MSEELKPCPLCGGEIITIETHPGRGEIYCVSCDLVLGGDNAMTPDELTEKWNTRTTDQAIAATLGVVGSEVGSEVTSEVRGGKLTAEQVCEATYAHSIHADCADADWQAIADELNAAEEAGIEIAKENADLRIENIRLKREIERLRGEGGRE